MGASPNPHPSPKKNQINDNLSINVVTEKRGLVSTFSRANIVDLFIVTNKNKVKIMLHNNH